MNDDPLDVLVVAGEPCWPAVNGGRTRTGALALALAREFNVAVAAPPDASELDSEGNGAPLPVIELPPRERPEVRHSLGLRPRLGRTLLGPAAAAALGDIVVRTRPSIVLYAMSYLAVVCPTPRDAHIVVDFANVEADRLRSLANHGSPKQRVSAGFEATKALVWEPRVAQRASVAVAVHERDAQRLMRWGARPLVVPNTAVRPSRHVLSRDNAPVVFVANATYRPNVDAGNWLITRVWPLVRRRLPTARLRIVGHRTASVFGWANGPDGIEVAGTVSDLSEVLASAALVVAPVVRGGGTQLKVLEALAAGRVVVMTEYGSRSVPSALAAGTITASDAQGFAHAIGALLSDPAERHRRERAAWQAPIPTWDEVVAPLAARLASLGDSFGKRTEPIAGAGV
jgi:glycosyltransferase involved in cell wall biosynthesis